MSSPCSGLSRKVALKSGVSESNAARKCPSETGCRADMSFVGAAGTHLLRLTVLLGFGFLGSFKFSNLLLNNLVNTSLELSAIAELEEKLEPDKQRSQEDGLQQVVEKCRGTLLERAVADKLQDPAGDVGAEGDLIRHNRVLKPGKVAGGSDGEAECGEQSARDRLEQDVKASPYDGC